MIEVVEVKSSKDLNAFIKLPWHIHAHHQAWLPPLLIDERQLFTPKYNAAFLHCQTIMYLAILNGKVVGRIMGIIHHSYNQLHQCNDARFGYFECINKSDVFNALMDALIVWALKHRCSRVIGPFGFSDKEPQGFLTQGFDDNTIVVTHCNHPYMVDLIGDAGFNQMIQLNQYKTPINNNLLNTLKPYRDRVISAMHYKLIEFKRSRDIVPYIHSAFHVINKAYAPIFGFSPVTNAEIDLFTKRFLPVLNPHLLKAVVDKYGEMVGFIAAMPDLSDGLRKANGKLLPLGWWHIWHSKLFSKRLVLLLGAVDEKVRHKGLDAVLGYHLIKSALLAGMTEMDSHLIMAENWPMRKEIERLPGSTLYKQYAIFQKQLFQRAKKTYF
jgi:hypothetical protein